MIKKLILVTKEQNEYLKRLSKETGNSQAEIVRTALHLYKGLIERTFSEGSLTI